MFAVVPEEADRMQDMSLHDKEEDKTGDWPLLDDELGNIVGRIASMRQIDRSMMNPCHQQE
jgi:hypothetical protein